MLAWEIDNEFVVFKSLSMSLFQRRGPRDDIANLVTLTEISGSFKLYSQCRVE